MRQFAGVAVAGSGWQEESGYSTPRSGGINSGRGFDHEGYPVSPGGTVIRPPPGPPPLSPRQPNVPIGMGGGLGMQRLEDRPVGEGSLGGRLGLGIGDVGAPAFGNRPQEPAKYIQELPKLVSADLTCSAVVCGNWLGPSEADLSGLVPQRHVWFNCVEVAATKWYNQWLTADPLGRLGLDPGMVVAPFDSVLFQRVESRAVRLLLAALPANLKEDVITNRRLTTSSILFRVMCIYQPSGARERAHLSQLVSPEAFKYHKDAVKVGSKP